MANNPISFRSPLRYPGGKTCIYNFVSRLLRENNLVGVNYVEPFAGGAGLALSLLMDEYVDSIYLNDLDPSIYAFWYGVLNYPDDLCSWLKCVDVTVNQWRVCKDIQRNYKTANILDLAKSTLFLNRTNVSGVINGGAIGGMNQTGKYKIDARFNREELISRIENISLFYDRIHLSNRDGISLLRTVDGFSRDMFIYLDPPYYKKGSCLYLNAFSYDDHSELSKAVIGLNNLWMVSYDNQKEILNLYERENKVIYKLSQCTSNRIGDEVIIFDTRLKFETAIRELNSPKVV